MAILLLLVVGVQALLMAPRFASQRRPLGGDGPTYHQLAANLLERHQFSLMSASPYAPTVARTPGYPAFVAAAYAVSGQDLAAVRLVQFVVVAAAGWMLWLVAASIAGTRVGVTAAILCVTYQPLIVSAEYHLTESLATLLAIVIVWQLVVQLRRDAPSPWHAFWSGLVIGAATMVRPSFALLAAAPCALLLARVLRSGTSWRTRVAPLVTFGVGVCLLTAPWVLRNHTVSGQWLPFATGNGWSRDVSARQYSGDISYKLTSAEWTTVLQDYDRRWKRSSNTGTSNARAEIDLDHGYAADAATRYHALSAVQVVGSVPRRLAYLWSTGDLGAASAQPHRHRLIQAQHVMLIALAALGILLSWRLTVNLAPLLVFPVYLSVIHLVFHVEARYSLPGRPFLLVFAAIGFLWIFDSIRQLAGGR